MSPAGERQGNGSPPRPFRYGPGGRLGRYELLEELGRGGMGVVFKARDPAIGRLVAVKTVHLDLLAGDVDVAAAGLRFAREARAIGQLSHPNIVTLYDAQQEGDVAYLVMELVAGASLEALLRSGTTFSLERVRAIGMQVCEALEHAHSRGIVHRDIKPANILWQENGQVKVADFGVAHLARFTLTEAGQQVGTPSYMSPEQIQGKAVDGRADLFSVGAVLYELACNERAFPGDTISTIIYRILHTDPIPLHRLNQIYPPELDAIVSKALAKDPAARYPSARDLRDALGRQAAGEAPRAPATAPPEPKAAATPASTEAPRAPGPRRSRGLFLGGGVLAVAIAAALFVWYPRPPAAPPAVPGGRPQAPPTEASAAPPAPASPASPAPGSMPPAHPAPAHPAPAAPLPAGTLPATQGPAAAPAQQIPQGDPQGPRPLRVVFARDVRGVLPVDEGDNFYRDDPKVVLWVRWTNVRGKHEMMARWFDPQDKLAYASNPEPFESPADWWTTWTALDLRRLAAQRPGRWRVEVQLDGQLVTTANFTLQDQPRPPDAKPAPASAR